MDSWQNASTMVLNDKVNNSLLMQVGVFMTLLYS